MTDPTELDELTNGLTSGFWGRFKTHIEQEWGPSGETYQQAVRNAVAGPLGSEIEAVQRLKVVAAVQKAMLDALQWPENRVAQVRSQQQRRTATPSRRGAGL
jgi:hypothetical protein